MFLAIAFGNKGKVFTFISDYKKQFNMLDVSFIDFGCYYGDKGINGGIRQFVWYQTKEISIA